MKGDKSYSWQRATAGGLGCRGKARVLEPFLEEAWVSGRERLCRIGLEQVVGQMWPAAWFCK